MRAFGSLTACLVALVLASTAGAAPVLMISIDGLRPGDALGGGAPVLMTLAGEGAYATGVRNALPTVTYPNHTTLVTGVWPAVHGIASNTTFDPMGTNLVGWYWYSRAIKVPTLWDVVHAAGKPVASLGWPVTVDNPSIDFDIPEYWRAWTPDDAGLLHALASPGLPEFIEKEAHVSLYDMEPATEDADEAKAKAAIAMWLRERPTLFTLHLSSLDHTQHMFGPGSLEAHEALEKIDHEVGAIVDAARSVSPDVVVVIVSDHGFAPVGRDIELGSAFVDAGLITLGDDGKPTSWDAAPWTSGGSAAVVLAHPEDDALRAKVAAVLAGLQNDPDSGINRVIDKKGIAAMGGGPDMDFFVDAKIGYEFGSKLTGPLIAPGTNKGTHGYFPDDPEMRATLIIDGPGVPLHGSLGEVDMRDIAPTVAKLIGVALPSAQGKALF